MANVAAAGPYELSRRFNDLAMDLSRHDSQLERLENTNRYPDRSWGDWFKETARRFDDARTELIVHKPISGQGAFELQKAVLNLAADGGTLHNMANHNSTFGSGWGSTLNGAINAARHAADWVNRDPNPNPNPYPPNNPPYYPPPGGGHGNP